MALTAALLTLTVCEGVGVAKALPLPLALTVLEKVGVAVQLALSGTLEGAEPRVEGAVRLAALCRALLVGLALGLADGKGLATALAVGLSVPLGVGLVLAATVAVAVSEAVAEAHALALPPTAPELLGSAGWLAVLLAVAVVGGEREGVALEERLLEAVGERLAGVLVEGLGVGLGVAEGGAQALSGPGEMLRTLEKPLSITSRRPARSTSSAVGS